MSHITRRADHPELSEEGKAELIKKLRVKAVLPDGFIPKGGGYHVEPERHKEIILKVKEFNPFRGEEDV